MHRSELQVGLRYSRKNLPRGRVARPGKRITEETADLLKGRSAQIQKSLPGSLAHSHGTCVPVAFPCISQVLLRQCYIWICGVSMQLRIPSSTLLS